jgi:hypothetical protein
MVLVNVHAKLPLTPPLQRMESAAVSPMREGGSAPGPRRAGTWPTHYGRQATAIGDSAGHSHESWQPGIWSWPALLPVLVIR